jgi:hypothetical protein
MWQSVEPAGALSFGGLVPVVLGTACVELVI